MTRPLNSDYCSVCNDSKAVIFDIEANETVWGSCGIVLDNVDASVGANRYFRNVWRGGMPTSSAFHDMGLSTSISKSNTDAKGVPISSDQISKVK